MKTLLRTFALAAALTFSALATAHHAVAATSGNCTVICRSSTATPPLLQVTVFTTDTQCCSDSFNPCPAGYTPGPRSFTPLGGGARRCAV